MSEQTEARLRGYVTHLAGDIGERHVWRPRALAAAARYIRGALEAQAHRVVEHGYQVRGVDCSNLEVTIRGASAAAQTLVVGAHYDTVPGSPGADDNASGVAGLIEIARRLGGRRLDRTVRLVAFVNEEPPFFATGEMGSTVYAEAARARGEDIRLMLSLEMLGYYSAAPGSQRYPPLLGMCYPDRGDFIAFVSNLRSRGALRQVVRTFRGRSAVEAQSLASPAVVPGISWSDQRSFWKAGYRAVMVTDTAFYRYPYYHSPLDTPDRLSYGRMARVVEGLAATIEALAAET